MEGTTYANFPATTHHLKNEKKCLKTNKGWVSSF
jgi:hypothetical protein